jgi:hypothetical protein
MMLTDHHSMKGLIVGSVALLAMGVLVASPQAVAGSKVQVCHRLPRIHGGCQLILIEQSAVSAHLAHGDLLVAAGEGEAEEERVLLCTDYMWAVRGDKPEEPGAVILRERQEYCLCYDGGEFGELCLGTACGGG